MYGANILIMFIGKHLVYGTFIMIHGGNNTNLHTVARDQTVTKLAENGQVAHLPITQDRTEQDCFISLKMAKSLRGRVQLSHQLAGMCHLCSSIKLSTVN